ncbi:MAG TPA: hypothetical protein VGM94_02755 [Galbitalea sp.]|jgi:hypothetical protein
MTDYSREILADALVVAIATLDPDGLPFRSIPDPRELAATDGSTRGTLQIVREEFAHNAQNPQGDYLETFSVWAISPIVTRGEGEDDLDDIAQLVADALDSIKWVNDWSARRQQHPSAANAYQFTVHAITER